MRVFTKGSCAREYCRLSLCFSLISASDSSETGWLSGRPAFRCRNGFIHCSTDSSDDKVSIPIYILCGLKLGNITQPQCLLESWFESGFPGGKIYCYANFFCYANFSIVFGPNFRGEVSEGGANCPKGRPSPAPVEESQEYFSVGLVKFIPSGVSVCSYEVVHLW